ncbi:hypothetical protein D3C71_2177500 [compost metagenome]
MTTTVAPTNGPITVPTPPSRVIRITSPDMCQWASVSEASWNTTVLVEPARPVNAAEMTKASNLCASTL